MINEQTADMVLSNIYKEYYDLPNDIHYRKADMLMRTIVDNSEALMRARTLSEYLHPTLIFFSKELYDNQMS